MARASANIHLDANDLPRAFALDSGSIALWPDGPQGIAIIGSPAMLAKLADTINAFLAAQPEQQEAA